MHAGLFSDGQIAAFLSPRAEITAILAFDAALARVQSRIGAILAESPALRSRPPSKASTSTLLPSHQAGIDCILRRRLPGADIRHAAAEFERAGF